MTRARRWPAAIVLPVIVAAAVLVGARPSFAGYVPAIWPGGPVCATGALTAGPRTPFGGTMVMNPVLAHLETCAGQDSAEVAAARWGTAFYNTLGGYLLVESATAFDPSGVTDATPWTFTDGFNPPARDGVIVHAVCAVAGTGLIQVGCLRVETTGANRVVVLTPLPVDDPSVSAPIQVMRHGAANTEPECGACV